MMKTNVDDEIMNFLGKEKVNKTQMSWLGYECMSGEHQMLE